MDKVLCKRYITYGLVVIEVFTFVEYLSCSNYPLNMTCACKEIMYVSEFSTLEKPPFLLSQNIDYKVTASGTASNASLPYPVKFVGNSFDF
jgi:hypothetical protein